ncbi:MAG: type II toxin-antitoxin system ParD family antitoxin [Bacteroidota bacterium]
MTVFLTPEHERFARSLVESGRYRSTDEVIRDGLRLLEEAERVYTHEADTPELRAAIQKSLDSGPPILMTREEIRGMMGKRMAELRAF